MHEIIRSSGRQPTALSDEITDLAPIEHASLIALEMEEV